MGYVKTVRCSNKIPVGRSLIRSHPLNRIPFHAKLHVECSPFVDSTFTTVRISTQIADIGSTRLDSLVNNVI